MPVQYIMHHDYLSASYLHRDKSFYMPKMHYHLSHEINIVESGKVKIMMDDKLFTVNPGEILIIPKDVLHKNTGGYDHTRYIINFSEDYLRKYLSDEAINQLLFNFTPKKLTLTPTAMHNALNYAHHIVYNNLKFVYISALLSLFTDEGNIIHDISSDTPAQIDIILEYINENHTMLDSLDDISNNLHISKSYMCQLVKKSTGLTVSEYINGVRINHACELLREGNLNISETADACGFDSVSYFGKVFRKTVNLTPMEFKRNSRDQDLHSS